LSHGSGPVRADRLIDGAEEAGERSERDASEEGCAGKKTTMWGWVRAFSWGLGIFFFFFLNS
jgi:hypothetical protein